MLQSIDRLKVFFHVFSKGSVLAAAKALNISQSAVSQSLQKLENEIQAQLFTRVHKRLVPTGAGEHLFSVVRPFIAELEVCLKNIQQARDKPFGEIRIGAPVEFGKTYFPAILAGFREKYPDVTFFMKLGDPATLLPMVEAGELDFAFVDVFLTQKQFFANLDIYHFDPIVDETVILACSRHYYDTRIKNDFSLDNLRAQEFISYRHNAQAVKNWFKHHFDKNNVKIHVVLTVDSQQAIISAIMHNTGLGVIASHLASGEIKRGEIIPVNTSRSQIINQISMVQLQDKIPTFTEKVFQKFLLKRIQAMNLSSGFILRKKV